MNWWKKLRTQVRFKEPLSRHTTLRIGGPADVWVKPHNLPELKKIINYCVKGKVPYFILGKGSNILFSDRGFKGAVISLNAPFFSKIKFKGNYVFSGAGLSLSKLITRSQKQGLGGLESLTGIPASVAGALVMNAGSKDNSIGRWIKAVTVMDRKGKIQILNGRELQFGYRQSNLNKFIVLEAVLKLVKRNPQKIKENIAKFFQKKKKTQDLSSKSAGCVFKNPPHYLTAGQMIEACGLKRRRKGGAEISAKHANYIINRNRAKAKDILYLMHLAQREVNKKFGIHLKPEIEIIE